MTLTTHIAIAAVVAQPLMLLHPALGIAGALASHYLADAIPHWDYNLNSISDNNRHWEFTRQSFFYDFKRVLADGLIGLLLVVLILRPQTLNELGFILIFANCGILPDFLQGIYYTKKANFLKPLQKFHDFTHSRIKLGPYPLIGIPFQLAILIVAVFFL